MSFQLHVYLGGEPFHLGLGLDVLDKKNKPTGIEMWDFGSRNHYKYLDEEWIAGKKNKFSFLKNLKLLFGVSQGELRSWNPLKRFNVSRDEFLSSRYLKLKLPITIEQWEKMNKWLQNKTSEFRNHHYYSQIDLHIWHGGGIKYRLFNFNCVTFFGEALFIGGLYTTKHFFHSIERPHPVKWVFIYDLLKNYRLIYDAT